MNKILTEARFEGDSAAMKEITRDFMNANDVIRKIARKIVQAPKTWAANLFYLVSFVHPEVEDFYFSESTPNKTPGASETYDTILTSYAGRNTVDLVNKVRAGVLAFSGSAGYMGAGETEGTSAVATKKFISEMDALKKKVNDSENYSTQSQINTTRALHRGEASAVQKIDDFENAIDYNSLFGLKRDVVGEDKWEELQVIERWFYFLVKNGGEEQRSMGTELGESVFSYTKKFREIMMDSDVQKMLVDLDRVLCGQNIAAVQDAFAGELKSDRDIYQLGAMLAMCRNAKVLQTATDGQEDAGGETLKSYVANLLSGMGDEAGLEKFISFADAPFGWSERVDTHKPGNPVVRTPVSMKTPIAEWRGPKIHALINENAAAGKNPAAEQLSRKIALHQSKISTSVKKLGDLISSGTANYYRAIAVILGLIAEEYNPNDAEQNLENGLLSDQSGANDDIGLKTDDFKDEAAAKRNKATPPIDLADQAVENVGAPKESNGIVKDATVTVLDPEEADVTNAMILPRVSVPLFSVRVTIPSTNDKNLGRMYGLSVPMLTYAIIAYSGSDIPKMDWFSVESRQDSDENETADVHIDSSVDIDYIDIIDTIEKYFAHVAGSPDPTNAVMLRNTWIETINNTSVLLNLNNKVANYILSHTESTKYQQQLPSVMQDTIKYVKRNIFNIKEGAYNMPVTHDLKAEMVLPLSPINQESKGRLRLSGGVEGTVTQDGETIYNKTRGRVVSVKEENGEHTYRVKFGQNSGLAAGEFTDSNIGEWIPKGLSIMPDSASKAPQYALWVGVNFVSVWTDEGYMNSFRRPDNMVGLSNDAYMSSNANSPRVLDATENMKEFAKILHTVSAPAIDAVLQAGDALSKIYNRSIYDIENLIAFTQTKGIEQVSTLKNALTCNQIAAKTPREAAADILNGVLDSLFATKLKKNDQFYSDVSSLGALRRLNSMCANMAGNTGLTQQNILQAASQLLDVVNSPFTMAVGADGAIQITSTGVDYNTDEYFDDHGLYEAYRTAVDELRNAVTESSASKAIMSFKKLEKLYAQAVSDDFEADESYGRTGKLSVDGSISKRRNAAVSDKSLDTLTKCIETVMPALEKSPEVMKQPFCNVLTAISYAVKVPEEISQYRDAVRDYNANAAEAEPYRVTSGEIDGVSVDDLVQPDTLGERDDHTGDVLTNSIDEDALREFDITNETASYEDVTSSTMLGLIKCGPGMASSAGKFDITAGISPMELRRVASALDSAHETAVTFGTEGVRGKNIPIRKAVNRRIRILDDAMNSFYNFMTSTVPFEKRDILREVDSVGNVFATTVADCGDPTVEDMLDRMVIEFNQLKASVTAQQKNADENPEVNPDVVELEIASAVSTGIANIVLAIESYANTEHTADNAVGLERYGGEGYRYGDGDVNTSAADRLAMVGARNPGKSMGDVVNQTSKSALDKVIWEKFRDSTDAMLRSNERFSKTLSSIYEHLGKGYTIGYEGALIPFDDLVSKSNSKHNNSYQTLYGGEAKTALGAVLIHAIVVDELENSSDSPTYDRLGNILNRLVGTGIQSGIEVPKYLLQGLSLEDDTDTRTPIDMSSTTWAVFNENGSAQQSDRRDYAHFEDDVPEFDGLSAIGEAIGVSLADSDTPEQVAGKIRESVVSRKLAGSDALRDLNKMDSGYETKIFADTVQDFRETMNVSARSCTKSAGQHFIPLSVLYGCIDDSLLNTAMSQVVERASLRLREKANKSASLNVLRGVYGEKYGEVPKVQACIEDNISELTYDLAFGLLTWRVESHLDKREREAHAINANYRTDINDADTEVPNTSLVDILGGREPAKEVLSMFIEQIPVETLSSLTFDEMLDYARAFVEDMAKHNDKSDPGDPLRSITNILSSLGNSDGADTEAAVATISEILGAGTNTAAGKLVDEYMDALNSEKPSTSSGMRNLAERVLRDSISRSGELRELYLDKFGTEELKDIDTRRTMHGTVPIIDNETINDSEGAARLYSKIESALSGDLPKDESVKILDSIREFHINQQSGEVALEWFNQYYDELKSALVTLTRSTHAGVKGALDNKPAKQEANKCSPDGVLAMEGAGPTRRAALDALKAECEAIQKLLDKNSDGYNAVCAAIEIFAEQHCMWSPDMTPDELRAAEQASNARNADMANHFIWIRKALAKAVSQTKIHYDKAAIKVAAAASAGRGITSMGTKPISYMKKLLSALVTAKGSPIKKIDDEMYPEGYDYMVNGSPRDEGDCIAILSDAVDKYAAVAGPEAVQFTDDMMNEDFFNCIRLCSSMKRDSLIDTNGIATILLKTLRDRKVISLSDRKGCVRFKHRIKYKDYNNWYTFDIPVSIIRDMVNRRMSGMDFSESANEWNTFAHEMEKYTNRGNYIQNATIRNPELRNTLYDLFRGVVSVTLTNFVTDKVKNLSDAEFDAVRRGQTVTTDDDVRISIKHGGYYNDISGAFRDRIGGQSSYEEDISLPEHMPGGRRLPPSTPQEQPQEPPEEPQEPPEEPEEEDEA